MLWVPTCVPMLLAVSASHTREVGSRCLVWNLIKKVRHESTSGKKALDMLLTDRKAWQAPTILKRTQDHTNICCPHSYLWGRPVITNKERVSRFIFVGLCGESQYLLVRRSSACRSKVHGGLVFRYPRVICWYFSFIFIFQLLQALINC